MDSQITTIFLVAFIASVAGSESSHKLKKLNRSLYAKLVVHFCSGFSAALLSLIILSKVSSHQIPIAILLGAFYGYIMAKSNVYSALR